VLADSRPSLAESIAFSNEDQATATPFTPPMALNGVIDKPGDTAAGGIDTPLGPAEMLAWNFPSVTFGLLPGIPDADGSTAGGTDGVRVGVSRIVSMNPNGSATSGTLYLHGRRRAQYAVEPVR
jgi:hypothetical protein